MSRGLGKLQKHILDTLQCSLEPVSAAQLRRDYESELWAYETQEWEDFQRSMTAQRRRAIRISVGRALRQLEAADKIKRNSNGTWEPVGVWAARKAHEEGRTRTAFHEAGHAVIGLAVGLQVGAAIIDRNRSGKVVELGSGDRGVVVSGQYAGSISYFMRGQKLVKTSLDAFGKKARARSDRTPEEHHGEVIVCMAGGMAEAKLRGDITEWQPLASNADMSIARRHRRKLSEAAKSWEEYEQESAVLVERHWPMIEAVASALLQKRVLSGYEIDNICQRVRRHKLKTGAKRSRVPK